MFSDFGIDARLLQAVTQMGFEEPTQIQQTAIPLALNEKKDIVAMARTGSGKTAAYLLPILQFLLTQSPMSAHQFALVIVPSRELADQIVRVLAQLTQFASKKLRFVNIAQKLAENVRATLLSEPLEIVVATPASALEQFQLGKLDAAQLGYIVFDEADLLASYGYEDDLKELHTIVSKQGVHPQSWLMSATLNSEEITTLKEQWTTKPVVLQLQDEDGANNQGLQQYYVRTPEVDKFLLMYVIFKLGLIRGKTLVFTNEIDRAYRLRMFLEQFGIRSAVLNSEMPQESRVHIVQQFDRHWFNLLIATDEANLGIKGAKRGRSSSSEFSASRGLDFKGVACVINFDLPVSSKAYVHRVGRTARANEKGMALSFVVPSDEFGKNKIACSPSNKHDEKVLARIMRANDIKPYQFDMTQVDRFRYRMEDAFRAVTRSKVREARVNEIKHELLTSEKLQRHFEENPDDLAALRHDSEIHTTRQSRELKNIPSYLLPSMARQQQPIFAEPRSAFKKKVKKQPKHKKKRRDPLKTFGR